MWQKSSQRPSPGLTPSPRRMGNKEWALIIQLQLREDGELYQTPDHAIGSDML